MAYLSLYRKYRPGTFAEVLGQDHVTQTLANAVNEGRVAHAYLFTGPRGTGKTSTARILAKALNCEKGPTADPCGVCASCVAITNGSSLDVFEMDAASHSGVDDAREILSGVALATAGGRKKVYVIDEVHMLTSQAFNALLKTLEEPPDHVVFVLATTEAHKVLPTIVSRTQRFDFRRISADVLEQHLGNVAKLESIDIEQDAIALIARHAEGGARDALSALDQLSTFGKKISYEDAETLLGRRDEDTMRELFTAIASGDVGAVFRAIQAFVAQGADMRQLSFDCLEHARSLLLLRSAPAAEALLDVAAEERAEMSAQAEELTETTLLRLLDLLGKAIIEMRNAPHHRLLLEVALVRAAAPETDPGVSGLLGRIERLERRLGIDAPGADAEAAGAPAPATRARPAAAPRVAQPRQTSAPVTAAPAAETTPPSSAPTTDETAGDSWASHAEPPPDRAAATPTKRGAAKKPAAAAPKETTPDEAPGEVAAPPSAPATIGLAHFRDSWPAVMRETSKASKRIAAFLHGSRPVEWDGQALTVEVQFEFHAHAMSEVPNKEILAKAIHAALGVSCGLRFAERGKAAVAEEPATEEAEPDYTDAQPVEGTEHDPLEALKKGLNAEIVEEKRGT